MDNVPPLLPKWSHLNQQALRRGSLFAVEVICSQSVHCNVSGEEICGIVSPPNQHRDQSAQPSVMRFHNIMVVVVKVLEWM